MDKYLDLIVDADLSTPGLRQAYARMLAKAITNDVRVAEEVEDWARRARLQNPAQMHRSTRKLIAMRNLLAGLAADAEPIAPQPLPMEAAAA